jgi:hypothetical protein
MEAKWKLSAAPEPFPLNRVFARCVLMLNRVFARCV